MPYGSIAARNAVLASWLGDDHGASAPTVLHVALLRHATLPATVLGTEPTTTGGYARAAVDNDATVWTVTDETGTNDLDDIRWPTTTGVYSITDPLNQWAIYDLSTGGICWAFGPLDTPITITGAGQIPVISAGDLVVSQEA